MKEEKRPFDGRVKCIYCELDNFSEGIESSELVKWSHETGELDRLSKASGQDFLSVICDNCTVPLFLSSMALMMHEDMIKRSLNEATGHKIMSKGLFEIAGKYSRRTRLFCMRQATNFPIDDGDIPSNE